MRHVWSGTFELERQTNEMRIYLCAAAIELPVWCGRVVDMNFARREESERFQVRVRIMVLYLSRTLSVAPGTQQSK